MNNNTFLKIQNEFIETMKQYCVPKLYELYVLCDSFGRNLIESNISDNESAKPAFLIELLKIQYARDPNNLTTVMHNFRNVGFDNKYYPELLPFGNAQAHYIKESLSNLDGTMLCGIFCKIMRDYVVFKGKVREQRPLDKRCLDPKIKNRIDDRMSEIRRMSENCKRDYLKHEEFLSRGYIMEYKAYDEDDDDDDNDDDDEEDEEEKETINDVTVEVTVNTNNHHS
jgi:hypothetical protein